MSRDILMPIAIDDIVIADGRRDVNAACVKRLADSIDQIGLRHPITVREKGEKYVLIAGRHRVEAVKKLGREHIQACIVKMTNDDARLWEIAENLHRADLSNLEKAEQIEEWRRITASQVSNGLTPSGGRQPSEAGVRKTSEALGVSYETVRNAEKIAGIVPEAKQAAIDAGVTSVRELVEIAAQPTDKQTGKVIQLASNHPKDDYELSAEWRRGFERHWNKSPSPEDREWAKQWIDSPIMDARYGG